MKKILLINWRDIKNPEAGGAEIYYHEIFRRIAAQGTVVTVIAHRFKGSSRRESIDGIAVVRIGGKYLFNYQIIPFLLRHQFDYDLIIEDLNKIPFLTPRYLRQKRLHLVMHFFGRSIFREAPAPLALYVFLMEKLVPAVYKRERFIAISQSTADEIALFGVPRSKIAIVEPGIDVARFTAGGIKNESMVIAYIGRLMKYKNIQFIIEALPLLRRAIPELALEIGGTGDYLKQLKKCALEFGVVDSVRFLGRVSETEKQALLSRATLMVNPSAKEGWGITNIEANLCGTISVSSNVPGLRDSVVDGVTGLLYTPDDLQDFCVKVVAILHDTERRVAMEQAAYNRARQFDWDHIAAKMLTALLS